LREEALHHVAEAAAEREKRCLRSIPGNQSVRFRGGREIAHDVDARCAGETGRTDVHRDEDCAALRVGHGGAIVEAGIFVALARLDDLEAVLLESDFDLGGEVKIQIGFADAGCAACAEVGAAVSGIEDYDAGALALRLRGRLCPLRS